MPKLHNPLDVEIVQTFMQTYELCEQLEDFITEHPKEYMDHIMTIKDDPTQTYGTHICTSAWEI